MRCCDDRLIPPWQPRSEWKIASGAIVTVHAAIVIASQTSDARM